MRRPSERPDRLDTRANDILIEYWRLTGRARRSSQFRMQPGSRTAMRSAGRPRTRIAWSEGEVVGERISLSRQSIANGYRRSRGRLGRFRENVFGKVGLANERAQLAKEARILLEAAAAVSFKLHFITAHHQLKSTEIRAEEATVAYRPTSPEFNMQTREGQLKADDSVAGTCWTHISRVLGELQARMRKRVTRLNCAE